MCLPIDLDEHFIQMPFPLGMLAQIVRSLVSNFTSEQGSKPIDPKPNAFMTVLSD